MDRSEFFHVGIVVPDLDAARARFTELLGVVWGPVVHTEAIELRDGAGNDLVFPNKICYSTAAPHLELIEEVPGSEWECNEHSNLHHIGVWSGALDADSGQFSAVRCPLTICGRASGDAPVMWAYHRDPLGVRIELVDVALRPMMEEALFAPPAGS
jgi:catechol 2,3-dioxygenase-like lactoylglutathione lyase family enzyme